jgi:hypothetical protein
MTATSWSTSLPTSDGLVWAIDKRTLKHYSPDGQLWQSLKPNVGDPSLPPRVTFI